MRSRYTAFVLEDEAHLLRSWHHSSRPADVRFVPGQRWTGPDVMATAAGDLPDLAGEVEFRAHHEHRGRKQSLHELSRFVRDDTDRWVHLGAVEAQVD
jgi:SEC-C motif-containing protein